MTAHDGEIVSPGADLQDLLAAESRLDGRFLACAATSVFGLLWPTLLRLTGIPATSGADRATVAIAAGFAITYVRFAFALAAAARAVGQSAAGYAAWLVAAPVLWILLPLPIVSTVILASPLSLKFLVAAQLRAAIHERTFAR